MGPIIVVADEFDNANGQAIARGAVIWQDTSAKITIEAALAQYNDATGYLKASGGRRGGRPLLITVLDGDSLWLTADTLFSRRLATPLADTSQTAAFAPPPPLPTPQRPKNPSSAQPIAPPDTLAYLKLSPCGSHYQTTNTRRRDEPNPANRYLTSSKAHHSTAPF
ncbi:MAG: hypothetical protein HC821_05545 [Lewinella sp.]|nr:hypothetical protein [Lewinella sp.]